MTPSRLDTQRRRSPVPVTPDPTPTRRHAGRSLDLAPASGEPRPPTLTPRPSASPPTLDTRPLRGCATVARASAGPPPTAPRQIRHRATRLGLLAAARPLLCSSALAARWRPQPARPCAALCLCSAAAAASRVGPPRSHDRDFNCFLQLKGKSNLALS